MHYVQHRGTLAFSNQAAKQQQGLREEGGKESSHSSIDNKSTGYGTRASLVVVEVYLVEHQRDGGDAALNRVLKL